MKIPNSAIAGRYDRFPVVRVPGEHAVAHGETAWRAIDAAARTNSGRPVILVDAYPGVDVRRLMDDAAVALPGLKMIDMEDKAGKSTAELDELLADSLTADRVFGVMNHQVLEDFYDADRLSELSRTVAEDTEPVLVFGWGASLLDSPRATRVLADLSRWEIQKRQRAGAGNWRANNGDEDALRKFKRGYFIEWRVADRHKRQLFERIDFVLDSTNAAAPVKIITGDAFRAGISQAVSQPIRVVPFFDPGVWGGQWMKQVFGLESDVENYAWCFDCVPEENSLLLQFGSDIVELPAIDAVLMKPAELLGTRTFGRFGAEFPIRFDFLDTMGGGNLSLQVHPLNDYIYEKFGMRYTQDESYYILDADDDARVYLGLRENVDREAMIGDLRAAERGEISFPVEKYVNTFPARKHDHFSIPSGTIHCSGANSMVLEISATPYIFTFKMWDWDRVGLDGLPRPIHLDHAIENVRWDRTTPWVEENLVRSPEILDSGAGWVEERTGLNELEFIEVRRHWFSSRIFHDTAGTVNVFNLVEGTEAVIESPTAAFEPFVVHYAETFILPAAVGIFTIAPTERSLGETLATVKAFVRGTQLR
jgi:mannose-6-phosphate isomerase class I/ribosomal protein S21